MKILVLSNYYPEHSGGIEFVAMNLVKHWRLHHHVRWMACDVQEYPHICTADDVPLPALNFTEKRLGFPYPIPVPLGRSFFYIFRQVKECDVIHIHDCLYFANLIAFFASRWYSKPLLITQHVALVPYPQWYKNTMQKLAYYTFGKLVLQNSEGIVFISERVKAWFEKNMLTHTRTAFIPNGVDRKLFYPATPAERKSSRARLNLPNDKIIFLFVGRFTEKKGLHVVREIAQARPDFHWLLIGRKELDPRTWGLANVQIISPQPQTALRDYYIAADLFVLPSVGEGVPLSLQEALSCGLPAAISKETADFIPDAPLIKLDVKTVPDTLQTLDSLLATPEKLLSLRNTVAEYAKRWDWANVGLQYEDLFTSLD